MTKSWDGAIFDETSDYLFKDCLGKEVASELIFNALQEYFGFDKGDLSLKKRGDDIIFYWTGGTSYHTGKMLSVAILMESR